jgi:OmpA-OmpF porin, OOP family
MSTSFTRRLAFKLLLSGFFVLIVGCSSTVVRSTAGDQLPSAQNQQSRITDGVISADRKYFASLQARLAALNAKGISAGNYSLSKATAWLEFAQEEYTDNDRSGIVERLLGQSVALIQKLERGDVELSPVDRVTSIVQGSKKIRTDLWLKLDAFHRNAQFECAQGKIAQAEVQLVWAGHEEIEGGWRHSKPYVEIAEDMVASIEKALLDCEKKNTVIALIKPSELPEPKFTTPAVIKDVEVERISLATDTLFKFNKTTLDDVLPAGKQMLDSFVQSLLKNRSIERILITGHTDRLGSSIYNLKLSEARAQAVAQYLIEKGFSQTMIQVAGAGESDPITTCSGNQITPELQLCLQPNRRVEVRVRAIK